MRIHIRNIILAATCLLPFAARAQERPLTVCEGKTWNYCIENSGYGHIERIDDLGYHFDGTREADGHTYGVFRDGSGKEAALMRQEGGKVYRNLEPYLREYFNGDEEAVLYDFGLKPGEEYISLGFVDNTLGLSSPVKLTVLSVDTIEVHGQKRIRQRIESELWNDKHTFTVVEGIGPDYGRLDAPQWGPRNAGFSTSIYHTVNVTDSDGNTVFTERDFGTRDYEPMLVEGRVMENYFYSRSGYEPDSYIRSVFDGTVEKFGKTYHRLRPEGSESEGTLFREENGKVWRLANESGKIIFTPEAKEAEPFEADREFLVYDMGMSPGDTLTLYSSFRDAFSGPDYEGVMWGRTMRLDSVGTVVIGGKDRIVQFWSSNRHEPVPGTFKNGLQVVEGLGNMCGTFEFSCVRPFYAGDTDVFDLNRVIESDGTITYEQYEPVPMIREGQVWEYHLSGGKADVGNVERLLRFGFKGTVERNGTEYHRLIDLDTEETVALMREEYRQVYILLPEDKDSGEKEREALLYDFGYRMLSGVESVAFRGHDWDNPFGNPYMHVQSASHLYGMPSDNGTRIRWVFVHYGPEAPYSAIEGIGSIWGGTLFAPVADKTEYTDSAPRIVFNNLYDSEGNVLFPGADKKVAGMETVSGDDRANDSRIYDLNGREIRNPEPGTVYIQGGRKHVAPRR